MSDSVRTQPVPNLAVKEDCSTSAKEMMMRDSQTLGEVATSISFATPEHSPFHSGVNKQRVVPGTVIENTVGSSIAQCATTGEIQGTITSVRGNHHKPSNVTPPEKDVGDSSVEIQNNELKKSQLMGGAVSLSSHIKENIVDESTHCSTVSDHSAPQQSPLVPQIKGEACDTSLSNPVKPASAVAARRSSVNNQKNRNRTDISGKSDGDDTISESTTATHQHIKMESPELQKYTTKEPILPLSPVPSYHHTTKTLKTPTRSPVPRQGFSDLPHLGSPGILLSPYCSLPTTQADQLKGMTENDKERDRSGGVTPTNFAGADLSSTSFDASNILAWCSPTAQHLFSPGGGLTNTPRGLFGGILRTPRTPTNNPLFFSDPGTPGNQVPSLNSSAETAPSVSASKKAPGSGSIQQMPSMICVSPLTKRSNSVNSTQTKSGTKQRPSVDKLNIQDNIDFKNVFASPKVDSNTPRTERPQEVLKIEKHMAERDLMEDEDLRLLLQLAQTTPRKNASTNSGTPKEKKTRVFRSPRQAKIQFGIRAEAYPPTNLQLPFIGQNGRDPSPSKLSMKGAARENNSVQSDDFTPPTNLPVNPNSKPKETKTTRKTTAGTEKKKKKANSRPLAKKAPAPNNAPTLPRPGAAPGVYTAAGHPQVPYSNPPLPPPHPGMHHAPHPAYPHHPPIHMHRPGMPPTHPPYHYQYPPGHPPPVHPYSMYSNAPIRGGAKTTKNTKKDPKDKQGVKVVGKRAMPSQNTSNKKPKKSGATKKGTSKRSPKSTTTPVINNPAERQKAAAAITAMNAAAGHKNDKAAALASAIMRGVTMRPSGKWQAQLYYAGKSRYIGVFDTREKAALAYEIAREKLKTDKSPSDQGAQSIKETEANVNAARKAAFEGVNEKDPRITG